MDYTVSVDRAHAFVSESRAAPVPVPAPRLHAAIAHPFEPVNVHFLMARGVLDKCPNRLASPAHRLVIEATFMV